MSKRIEIHGHRGARGLWPENTLEGFRRAIALGIDAIEMDAAVSADGVVLVTHDPALNPDLTRGPDGAWLNSPTPRIRDLSAATLAFFDVGRLKPGTDYAARYPDQVPIDGARIPTLAQVFALPPPIRFNVETKTFPDRPGLAVDGTTMVREVVAQADRAGVTARLIVQSFDWSGISWLRRARPEIDHSFLTEERTASPAWWDGIALASHGGSVPRAVKAAGGASWGPHYRDLTQSAVAEARALGLRVLPWTVNEAADMRRLIAWGVDGLITDRPDRARAELAASGRPVPAASPPAR